MRDDFLRELEGEEASGGVLTGGDPSPASRQSDFPLKMGKYDHLLIEEMRENSPNWQDVEQRRREEFHFIDDTMGTLFAGLWKPYPAEEEHLSEQGQKIKEVYDIATSLPEWEQLREVTRFDEVASAIGAAMIGDMLKLPEDGDNEDPLDGNGARQAIRRAVKQAMKDVQDFKEAEEFLGAGEGAGPGGQRSPAERIRLSKRVRGDAKLKRVAALVGRMKILAEQTHRRRVNHGMDELADIYMGDDLSEVMQDDLVRLRHPVLRTLFLKEYLESELLHYRFEGVDKVGRGPIIMRVDLSLSMGASMGQGHAYGIAEHIRRIDWAIAVATALAVIAKKERRDLSIGFFNSAMQMETEFPQGRYLPEQMLAVAGMEPSGGTNFQVPLDNALLTLSASKYKEKADMIFISDDDCGLTEQYIDYFNQQKEEHGFKVIGIRIGGFGQSTMDRFCDQTFSIDTLDEAKSAQTAMFSV